MKDGCGPEGWEKGEAAAGLGRAWWLKGSEARGPPGLKSAPRLSSHPDSPRARAYGGGGEGSASSLSPPPMPQPLLKEGPGLLPVAKSWGL